MTSCSPISSRVGIFIARHLQRWRDAQPAGENLSAQARARPLGGHPFAGITTVMRSPYLLSISLFVLLLASVTTFLYFEQARLVEMKFPDRADQTRVFGTIDVIVQSLTILSQVFITGRLVQRLGMAALLVAVPVVTMLGFVWLAFGATVQRVLRNPHRLRVFNVAMGVLLALSVVLIVR